MVYVIIGSVTKREETWFVGNLMATNQLNRLFGVECFVRHDPAGEKENVALFMVISQRLLGETEDNHV
jgi:hypothetical protein